LRDGRRRVLEIECLSVCGGSMRGTWRKGSFTGDFERWKEEGSGNGVSLCLWGLYEGNLEEGLLYWGPRGICQVRLWK
jgi:hypothetical protein